MPSKLCPFCMRMAEGEVCPHCGKNVNYTGSPAHLPAGYVVSGKHPYVLGAALGQGGFGITYIALDMVTSERVAIKEYYPTYCSIRADGTTVTAYSNQEEVYANGKERFLDEARTLKSLSDLPNIVDVLDFFKANNTAYLVMEFLDGSSLKQHAMDNGKFPAQSFLQQITPLMEDIQKMHDRGVIHRDIAPDNIILLPDGRMKLIDFGAARSYIGDKSMTVVVKKGFAPVEQYMSKGSTSSTDVYALAATIYYCITGTVPPDSAERQYDNIPLSSPSALGADLTCHQEQALTKALEIQQQARTQSIHEFLHHLKDYKEPAKEGVWTCPECGTSSTGTKCIYCGHQQKTYPKKKFIGIKITAVFIAIIMIVVAIYAVIPRGWHETDSAKYYYQDGRKLIGMHTIDGNTYYFNADGSMHRGWLDFSGNRYFFANNGKMWTGKYPAGNELYTFGDDGALLLKTTMLGSRDIPSAKESDDEVAYVKNDGKTGYGKYQILSSPIKNCTQLTVRLQITDLKSGKIDKWGLYVHELDGNWTRVGGFTVNKNNLVVEQTFNLYTLTSFDAYVCLCESLGSYWNFSFLQQITQAKVNEFYAPNTT